MTDDRDVEGVPLRHHMDLRKATLGPSGIYRCGGSSFVAADARIEAGVVIWHFVLVLAGATLERDVQIGSCVEVGVGAVIGRRSRISRGCFLPAKAQIGRGVFIGPNVTFTDDRFPRVLNPGETYLAEPPIVEDGANIGAGCTILPGVRIGRGALIAAGAVVSRDVPAETQVRGEPARIRALAPVVR